METEQIEKKVSGFVGLFKKGSDPDENIVIGCIMLVGSFIFFGIAFFTNHKWTTEEVELVRFFTGTGGLLTGAGGVARIVSAAKNNNTQS